MMDYGLGAVQVDKQFGGYFSSATLEDKVLVIPDSPKLWIKRKIAKVWQPPLQIGQASGAYFIETTSEYKLGSTSIDYSNYTYSFVIINLTTTLYDDAIPPNVISTPGDWGFNNPTEDQEDGYIITVSYETQDGAGDQQDSIRLQSQYAITSIDEDFIFTSLTEI